MDGSLVRKEVITGKTITIGNHEVKLRSSGRYHYAYAFVEETDKSRVCNNKTVFEESFDSHQNYGEIGAQQVIWETIRLCCLKIKLNGAGGEHSIHLECRPCSYSR